MGIEIFHDSVNSYIEHRDVILRSHDNSDSEHSSAAAPPELPPNIIEQFIQVTKAALTPEMHPTHPLQVEFATPLEDRAAIRFKCLVAADSSVAPHT